MGVNGNHSDLTEKQRRAIAALLSEPTTKKAAAAAKVGETTIHRWLNEPAFSAALKESRERVFESTLAALQGASSKAVETLLDVMKDEKAQPSARVSAAKTVLELAIKGRDQLELGERLAYLEKLWEIEEQQRGRMRAA
jgi:hypothetical protein